ncbi:endophilin-A [Caerostris extrusa]|uniref:Endophilin-A n=1 Tax=Caerostris extrusa TaxID=172846 RepID=A0AAV4TR14_CAEEX|nr:endophilin-A [Caerostris extrusa]
MASDNRAGSLSKSVQKHAGRAKERILQNLGKADRTTDDILNLYISNFNKQHATAQRLSKEFKNYVSCARAMQAASKSLMDTLTEMYEQNWAGCEQLPVKTQVLEMERTISFCHKLNDQVGVPIATYLSQFPEIRAKERLDEARKLYEVINNELHDELPALLTDTRPYEEIEFKKARINGEILSSNTLPRTEHKMREINLTVSQTNVMNADSSNLDQMRMPLKSEKDYEPVEMNDISHLGDRDSQKMDELYDIPVGATTTDLPVGVLYRVRSTYKYTGEDVDELSFEIGDIIRVVEYDDPEEQEEGWLMGIKEATGEKGLFPANFTRPI